MKTVLFATGNAHKIEEANEAAQKYGVRFRQVKCGHPEIRADFVDEVAKDSVLGCYAQIKKPLIVEDTGLFIDSLNGFPGVYSAHIYRLLGNKGILRLLSDSKDRRATFHCAISYADEKGVKTFLGSVPGTITTEERGEGGFGYDPIFLPAGYAKTWGEDRLAKKNLSHRVKAVESLCKWLNQQAPPGRKPQ
ncbi:Non-canonical purine NTP pyrophosphatase [uncultured archaeon]|nr:Non-canonical purine NTP pyrophosphatase [uncultured archaeon]